MNTIDDLRATLDRASRFDDTEAHLRRAAVRQRVRAVRRRRAGAVAVAAAVTLVVATGTVGLVRSTTIPEPAGPSLGDVQVPQRIDVSGFPYELSETQRAADDGSVEIGESGDGPIAVSLVATRLGSGEATLWSGYIPVARVRGGEQVSAAVDAVAVSDLRVELDGTPDAARAAVAVYTPTGELAPGVASDGVVFRQRYGDRELVDAAFGRAGGDATVDVPEGSDDLDVSAYCHSATAGLWLHRDGVTGSTSCAELDTGNDPGAANQDYLLQPQLGERAYSVYVTQGKDGPRATGVDVTFGVGIYRQSVPPTRVLGQEVPTVIDGYGRTWRLDDVLDSGPSEYDVDTSQGDVLIGVVYVGATEMSVTWRGAPEGGWGGFRKTAEPQGPGAMYPGVLLAGDHTVQLHLGGPDADSRLLVYRPV